MLYKISSIERPHLWAEVDATSRTDAAQQGLKLWGGKDLDDVFVREAIPGAPKPDPRFADTLRTL